MQELRSFLSLINYYGEFIPNVSKLLAPLHLLLRNGQRWVWSIDQESAFTTVKNVLSSDKVLMHFNPKKEIIVVCDASPIGVGAFLSQLDDKGEEKPVIFASRAPSDAERKYSQTDREGLTLVFAVKKSFTTTSLVGLSSLSLTTGLCLVCSVPITSSSSMRLLEFNGGLSSCRPILTHSCTVRAEKTTLMP
ncbi:polyprotein [Elysia marginata]|uniref:Polyprotein n=1 Tax=Elysia marginata TaxID=1093978 RepID=A0AAV4JTC0_9GAST|nr:polyprotein [Elysia marginata]